jgi:hypothetical protein
VDVRRAVAKGMGYGEAEGSVVTKRRSASAGSISADALERDERASVMRRCKAEGSGSDEVSVGGYGDRRKVWMTLASRLGVVMIVDAIVTLCLARR